MNGMHGTSDYLFINLIVVMIENFFFLTYMKLGEF